MIGKLAPQFEGIDQNESKISLSDYKGKKIVLYFYPRDNTPGCTAQACNLRDNIEELLKHNIQVIGVSSDDSKSHRKFETKHELPFPLIADTDKSIHQLFDVWKLKKFMGKEYMGTVRTTFLINEEGIIEHIIAKPKTKDQAAQVMNTWELV